MAETAAQLIAKIRAAAGAKIVRPGTLGTAPARPEKILASKSAPPPSKLVAIGISTGGPQALEFLLAQLPPDFPGAIVVVQHMPEGFTEMFARRLDEVCSLRVKEAQSGDLLQAGRVLICPGSRHIKVKRMPRGDVVVLNDDTRVNGHRPSVDVLFHSVADEYGPQAIAVLMTGMGDDGAEGLGAVKRAGGMTIAQNEESCVVFGMPKAAIERGYATRVVALDVLPATLQTLCVRNDGRGQNGGVGKALRAGI
jgi:two-component system chemotaxis response regulator CheB